MLKFNPSTKTESKNLFIMNKWKRYVFTEANRQYRLTNKVLPLSHFIKRSWRMAKVLEERNIIPYCGFN